MGRAAWVGAVAAAVIATSTGTTPGVASAVPPDVRPRVPKTHTVTVGSNPLDVAISQSLGQAFVANDGSISVVSLITHRELAAFSTGVGHGQNAIALMRRETQGYVTDLEESTLVVFDTETRAVLKRIEVGNGADDVVKANTPQGQRAYVSFVASKRLVEITTSTGAVTRKIPLPQPTQSLATAPGGKRVWAGSDQDNYVFVVDTRKGKVTRSVDVGRVGPVTSIAFAPGGKRAWVAGPGGLAVIDTRTYKTVKFFPVLKLFTSDAPNMGAVALDASGRYAFVEDTTFPDTPRRGEITMIKTHGYRIRRHTRTGNEPGDFALDTRRGVAYVPNYNDDTLTYFAVPR